MLVSNSRRVPSLTGLCHPWHKLNILSPSLPASAWNRQVCGACALLRVMQGWLAHRFTRAYHKGRRRASCVPYQIIRLTPLHCSLVPKARATKSTPGASNPACRETVRGPFEVTPNFQRKGPRHTKAQWLKFSIESFLLGLEAKAVLSQELVRVMARDCFASHALQAFVHAKRRGQTEIGPIPMLPCTNVAPRTLNSLGTRCCIPSTRLHGFSMRSTCFPAIRIWRISYLLIYIFCAAW